MKTNHVPPTGWIRALRDQAGISSYELARRAGVSQPTVMNWERREREGALTLASLRRAAEALEADFTYLLELRNPPAKETVAAKPRKRVRPGKKKTMGFPTRQAAIVAARQKPSVDPNSIWE